MYKYMLFIALVITTPSAYSGPV